MLVAERDLDVAREPTETAGERGVFLFPCGQHPFADTSLPDVLSFPDNIE
ncbi:MAG TPA: hypothetical protein VK584_02045 [Streptosporangiaceae bacterium]|nr:hypothetical protein [Streptosporangiaceae bacterium]